MKKITKTPSELQQAENRNIMTLTLIGKLKSKLTRLYKEESGQAMVEYVLMVSLSVVVLIVSIPLFIDAISEYYTEIVRLLCLPIP